MQDNYDIIIIGSGLGGLTAANRLARSGYSVLLAEQHFQFGGLATYFRRKSHIFDVALHGFPIGMQKSLRKYWGKEFAAHVVQVKRIRFDNPQFQLETTFDTLDFTRIMRDYFKVSQARIDAFFAAVNGMNYYDDQAKHTVELFEEFFPGRSDVWRLLMEPITYANGSTLYEPAISYGIVFGNFMSKGVYTFRGGTDLMLDMMLAELRRNGVDCESSTRVEKILVANGKVRGAVVNGREIGARAVVSNGSLPRTVHQWVGDEHFDPEFLAGFGEVAVSNSSSQVYIGIKPGEKIDDIGDLLFTSVKPTYDSEAIASREITSRTFSVYYPNIRPGTDQYTIVASMNSRIADWDNTDRVAYKAAKQAMIDSTVDALEKYLPGVSGKIDHLEAATPQTFLRYTGHVGGASFGTKFNGLDYSMKLSDQVAGLYHTGSVGIIMSGWLGAANYGVITANSVDKYLA